MNERFTGIFFLVFLLYFNGSCFNDLLFQCSTGCEFNDGCLAADKNYFDKENCVYYSCIAKNTTDGSITTQLKERWGEHRPPAVWFGIRFWEVYTV